jgi:single-strand DNA-binding protein
MNQQQNNLRLPEQNNVILVGRLTRDPELRRTGTGKAVCQFDIAISRRFKDAATGVWKDSDPTYVPIVVWGEMAERCAERLKKGVPVHVEGRLQTNSWTGQDGAKRSRLEVIASRVQFLSFAKPDSSVIGAKADAPVADEQVSSNALAEDDEDIPF